MRSQLISCLLGVLVAVLATAIRYGAYYWVPGFRTYMLHVLAIVLTAHYCGTMAALSATLASVLGIIWWTPGWDSTHMLRSDFLALSLFSVSGIFLSLFSGHYAKLLHERSEALEQLQQERVIQARLLRERSEALETLRKERVLRGILPTCAHCKRIRDPEGKYHSMEWYIQQHSQAKFSHGLCPDCLPLYDPDVRPPDRSA